MVHVQCFSRITLLSGAHEVGTVTPWMLPLKLSDCHNSQSSHLHPIQLNLECVLWCLQALYLLTVRWVATSTTALISSTITSSMYCHTEEGWTMWKYVRHIHSHSMAACSLCGTILLWGKPTYSLSFFHHLWTWVTLIDWCTCQHSYATCNADWQW